MSCIDPPLFASTLQDQIHPDTLIKITYNGRNIKDDGSVSNHPEADLTPVTGIVSEDVTSPSSVPRFVVAYWSIRGIGAPIRMMLCSARVPHWVALYDVIEDDAKLATGRWRRTSWIVDKEWMSKPCHPFINLPYLIDVEKQIVLVQSNAILSYLGRELGMMGSNIQSRESIPATVQAAKIDEFLCEIYDLRDVMVHFAYYGQPTAEGCWAQADSKFQKFESYLTQRAKTTTETSTFLIGSQLSAPDFHLYEMLDQYEVMAQQYPHLTSKFLDPYPKLTAFKKAMEELPQHQDYIVSFIHLGLPLNNPYAKFASTMAGKSYEQGNEEAPWRNKGVLEFVWIRDMKRPFSLH